MRPQSSKPKAQSPNPGYLAMSLAVHVAHLEQVFGSKNPYKPKTSWYLVGPIYPLRDDLGPSPLRTSGSFGMLEDGVIGYRSSVLVGSGWIVQGFGFRV